MLITIEFNKLRVLIVWIHNTKISTVYIGENIISSTTEQIYMQLKNRIRPKDRSYPYEAFRRPQQNGHAERLIRRINNFFQN